MSYLVKTSDGLIGTGLGSITIFDYEWWRHDWYHL